MKRKIELQALRDKAKERGENTKFSASEATDAILNLAAAAGSDLATASDIVTDALTALAIPFKVSVDETEGKVYEIYDC